MKLISEILSAPGRVKGEVHAQISNVILKDTKGGKPYYDVVVGDCSGTMSLKFWNNTQAFSALGGYPDGGFFSISADFSKNEFGVDAAGVSIFPLSPEQKEALLSGGGDAQARAAEDWNYVCQTLRSITVPQIRLVCERCISDPVLVTRFRRAAAAVRNHHARRGGLVAHTASMLRVAVALAPVYQDVVPGLLYAGVFFHDIGKVLENDTADGFSAVKNIDGELLGHIVVGVQIVNRLWNECKLENPEMFEENKNIIRTHLLHLVVSHHGTREFGSPQTPRTPEALLLHYIDNIDAHMEQARHTYEKLDGAAKGFFDSPTLKRTLATPLAWHLVCPAWA